jgi:hypothetical protein
MKKNSIQLLIIILVLISAALLLNRVYAVTNIDATDHWAWNDLAGYIDFYNTDTGGGHSVIVSATKVQGYASSSIGVISLDCATSPAGNICGTSSYSVLNDGSGNLSGWGWNDYYGWISFCGGQGSANCPGSISYITYIDASGIFRGYAWNDVLGYISFCGGQVATDCPGSIQYKVATSWVATTTSGYLDSSTFDTGVAGGAAINSVIWRGTMPSPRNSASVGIQLAVSSSSAGPWNYFGADGTANTWYGLNSNPGDAITVSYVFHNNARYFRYRVQLTSNLAQTQSPKVQDVIVNWSR